MTTSRSGSARWAAVLASLGVTLAACSAAAAPTPRPPESAAAETDVPATPAPSEPLTEEFPYDAFADPTTIDNQWLPIIPGTQWTWEGVTVEDGEAIPHRVVMAVTDMVKVIDGVTTVVVLDQDFADGQLVEAEIVFVAQDDEGNLWHLGQYPEEYEDGVFVDAPGWIAGKQDALAGYWMTADPRVGKRSYSQGWGPAVDWTDRGKAIDEGLEDCVAFGCFENVLVIEEWALDEPFARQLKFYAPGIGNIRVDWSGSADQEQEAMELVDLRTLDSLEMAKVRRMALDLEERAYEIRADIYGHTEPMARRP